MRGGEVTALQQDGPSQRESKSAAARPVAQSQRPTEAQFRERKAGDPA